MSRGRGLIQTPNVVSHPSLGTGNLGTGVLHHTRVRGLPMERGEGSALGTVPKSHPEPVSTPGNSWMPESPSLCPAPETPARRAAGGWILCPHPGTTASFRARISPSPRGRGGPGGGHPCLDGREGSSSTQLSSLLSLLPLLLWDFSGVPRGGAG